MLTSLLSLIYIASVIVLQLIFVWLTGDRSPVAIVLSTLAIAALFVPLRRQVQAVIDRRLYRHKYDAARILATLGAAARTEVDLDQLSASLIQAVEDTLQPRPIILWLRPVGGERKKQG